jgi:hypothetical protein
MPEGGSDSGRTKNTDATGKSMGNEPEAAICRAKPGIDDMIVVEGRGSGGDISLLEGAKIGVGRRVVI